MRLIVSADIHLGSPIRSAALRNPALGDRLKQASRDTFRGIVDLAIAEGVDALVLAGDIFDNDHPDLKTRAFLITQLSRAAQAGVPTVLIRGNHDALLNHGDLGPQIHLLHKGAPSVQIGEAWFHGLSFDKAHETKSFLPDYPKPVDGAWNIGLMHTSLDGSSAHDLYAPCAASDLLAHGYDLWCLGHIHAPFIRESGAFLAVMPGIPQPRHFGERTGGRVTMVTLDGPQPTYVHHDVAGLAFAEAALDLTECADQQDVLRMITAAAQDAQRPSQDTVLRLQVTTDRHSVDDIAALAGEVFEGLERVYLDKVKLHAPAAAQDAPPDDILRLMRAERDTPGFETAALDVLATLRAVLPPEIRDVLDDAELADLSTEAINDVVVALHRAET